MEIATPVEDVPRKARRTPPIQTIPASDHEAFAELCSLAHKRIPQLTPAALAQHVLSVTPGAEWPVRRAALEAIVRRWQSAVRDELRVAERPTHPPFGLYATRHRGATRQRTRPYRTRLDSVEPIRGSCNCPDYLRSSIGLCKHLLTILADLSKGGRSASRTKGSRPTLPLLSWDPVRPLDGTGDWLLRLRMTTNIERATARRARQWFDEDGHLRETAIAGSTERRRVVETLLEIADDPAVRALLTAEATRLGQMRDGEAVIRELKPMLRGLLRPLYPYQHEGVRRFLSRGRLLLADDMGLGKTAQAIAACHVLFESGRVRRGLLVVPAALKPQWLREWQLFSRVPIEMVDGNGDARRVLYRRTRRGFLITNYEQILRDLPWVQAWRPDIVVLDEAQRIKNWATKTAAYVKQLAPPYRLVLTGTPMENRLDELASIFDWVDDLALEPKWRLVPFHTTYVDGKREVGGVRHLDTLRSRLAGSMLRRRRPEVLAELPARTDTRVPVPLTPAQEEAHDAYNQPIARLIGQAKKRPLSQAEFLRLMSYLAQQRMICNGLALHDFETCWPELPPIPSPRELETLGSPKLVELRELFANLVVAQERKVVVFSQWRRMLRLAEWATRDLLRSANLRALYFTGEEGAKRRTQNLVDFHDDPRARVLFASDAGGVGLNLQRAASSCINLELPWNPAVLEQRVGRIYRLGQKDPVEVYHLVSEQGIESRIAGLVGNKRALFQGLFDGTSDEVEFERSGSFLARVEKLVEPIPVPMSAAAAEDEDSPVEPDDVAPALAEPPMPEMTDSPAVADLPVVSLAALLQGIEIRPAADGSVAITAPKQVAARLGVLFLDVARKLGAIPSA